MPTVHMRDPAVHARRNGSVAGAFQAADRQTPGGVAEAAGPYRASVVLRVSPAPGQPGSRRRD